MGKITENEEMLSTLQGNLPLRNLQHRPMTTFSAHSFMVSVHKCTFAADKELAWT